MQKEKKNGCFFDGSGRGGIEREWVKRYRDFRLKRLKLIVLIGA